MYIIGGIHGNEPEGLIAATDLAKFSSAELASVTIRILDDANPDGTAAHTRGNAQGRDLNRNWPASNFARGSARGNAPLSEPESLALHDDLETFAPHLVIVFHSIANGPFVNFDGPAGDFAEAFAAGASTLETRWRVVPQMGYRTPGSLGTYMGVDRGIPILTMEFRRGQDQASASTAAKSGFRSLLEHISRHGIAQPAAQLLAPESGATVDSPAPLRRGRRE